MLLKFLSFVLNIMIYRCMSPRLQGLDVLKIFKGVLQPEMNSWLIRERFWHFNLNVGWTHFALIRDKNLDQGNLMNYGPHSIWSQLAVPVEFRKDITVWGIIQHQHICFIFLFYFLPRICFKILFLLAIQKRRFYLKFCVNFS